MNFWEEVFKPLVETIPEGIIKEFSSLKDFEHWDKILIPIAVLFILGIGRRAFKKWKYTTHTKYNSDKEIKL